nr:hypothetical protein CFP56_79268 [Quercus suber]
MCPKTERESSADWKVLITANVIALAAAKASAMSGENSRGACSESEATALPLQSSTATPKPAFLLYQ